MFSADSRADLRASVRYMYQQPSANSPHGSIPASPTLSTLSNLVIREVTPLSQSLWSINANRRFGTATFHHVPSRRVLLKLPKAAMQAPSFGPGIVEIDSTAQSVLRAYSSEMVASLNVW